MFQKDFWACFSFNYENVFQCSLTCFFVVASHFYMEMFSMTNSCNLLFFRADLSVVILSASGNQYQSLTYPFPGGLGSCDFPCSPPQKWQGMSQLIQSSPVLPSSILYCSGTYEPTKPHKHGTGEWSPSQRPYNRHELGLNSPCYNHI